MVEILRDRSWRRWRRYAPLTVLLWGVMLAETTVGTVFIGTKAVLRLGVARHASENPLRMPDAPKNPFDLFGVRRGTEKSEIRKLFRKRVQTEHPDVNPDDPEAAERFQELVAAYNSIMGDELLPDEMNLVRIQMTPRYKKQLEADQSVKNGIFYALLPGLTIFVIGVAFVLIDTLGMLDPETQQILNAVKNKGPNSPPFTSPYGCWSRLWGDGMI